MKKKDREQGRLGTSIIGQVALNSAEIKADVGNETDSTSPYVFEQ